MGFFSGSNETKRFLDQSVQNRDRFNQQGDELAQYLRDEGGYYDTNERAYQRQADEAYQELRDEPGYTAGELAGVYGDPNAAFRYYNPDQLTADTYQGIGDTANAATSYGAGIRQASDRTGESLRGAATGGIEGLRRAAGGLQTGMRAAADEYGTGLTSAVDQMRGSMTAPADNQLSWQGGVYNYLRGENEGGLGEYSDKLVSATDRARLGLDTDFANEYRLDDSEMQSFRDVAASATRGQYDKMAAEAEMRAAAAGNTSPAAIAAIKQRLAVQGAAEAGDSATRAALAANQERASRERDIEGMRLGAERDLSSRETANAGNIYEGRTAGARTLADMEMRGIDSATSNRLKSASDLGRYGFDAAEATGRARMDAAKTGGIYGYNAEQGGADLGYKAASDIGDYDYRAAEQGGQAGINATRYGSDIRLANTRGNQSTGQELATGADTAGVARSTNIANARRAGQADYRGYLTDAQKTAQAGGQATQGQRIQAYGTQGGLVNDATSTGMRGAQAQDAKPSGFSKVLGAVSGVASVIPGVGTAAGVVNKAIKR